MAQKGNSSQKPRRSTGKSAVTKDTEKLLKELQGAVRSSRKTKKKGDIKLTFAFFVIVVIIGAVMYFINERNERKAAESAKGILYADFIDVGQGESTLIRSEGVTMLIDCGEAGESQKVISYIKKLGIDKLDFIVGTHPHSDHMGGMYKIIDAFDVGEVIIPHLADEDVPTTRFFEKFLDSCSEKDVKLTEAEVGRVITIGDGKAEIIAPRADDYDDLNAYSVGLYITHGAKSFLLTGDATKVSEEQMLEDGAVRHADVYKAAHHCSSTSNSKGFLEAIAPEYAVISCGKDNSYGHPHKKALDIIKKYTDEIYRTDECGTIKFTSDGASLTVSTER